MRMKTFTLATLAALLPVSLSAQYRTIYPYSVVPGGIDATTVNEHITKYEDLYRPAVLRRGRYYLEYNQAGLVAWTDEPKELAQATDVFVNVRGEIKRARCGNGLSKVPRLPHLIAPLPPDKVLDTPLVVYLEPMPPWLFPVRMPEIGHLLPEPELPTYISHPDSPPDFPAIVLKPSVTPPPYWMQPPAIGAGFIPAIPLRPVSAVPESGSAWLMICCVGIWLVAKGLKKL